MATERGSLGIGQRLLLLGAWIVSCGFVYVLGVYVGKGMRGGAADVTPRVALPVDLPEPPAAPADTQSPLTFYDVLGRDGTPAAGIPRPPGAPAVVRTAPRAGAPDGGAPGVVRPGAAVPGAATSGAATPGGAAAGDVTNAPPVPPRLREPVVPPIAPSPPVATSGADTDDEAPPRASGTVFERKLDPPAAAKPADTPRPAAGAPPEPAAPPRPSVPPRVAAAPPVPSAPPAPATPPVQATPAAPPVEPSRPPLATSASGRWTVYANPTRDRLAADHERAALRAKGYPAEVVTLRRDGDSWYRIRVGRYATQGQADEAARRLRSDGVGHAFVQSE